MRADIIAVFGNNRLREPGALCALLKHLTIMEIVKRLYFEKTEKESFQKTPCVIAMGTFDGLHKGHRDVIDAAAAYARKNLMRLAVFTFSNHPYAAIRPSAIPQALISPEEKVRLLKRWGVDLLIDVPFNRQLSLLSPEDFLHKLKQFNFPVSSAERIFPTVSGVWGIRKC